jgi:hypothetical protein
MHTKFSLEIPNDFVALSICSRIALTVQWCCDLNYNCPSGWSSFKFKLTQNTVMQFGALTVVLKGSNGSSRT